MIAHPPEGTFGSPAAAALVVGAAVTVVWFRGRSQRSRRRAWLTASGLVVLALAIGWPLGPVVGYSQPAAGLQHVALLVVAPALLCAGRAGTTILQAARELGLIGHRRRPRPAPPWRGREAAALVAAGALHAAVLTFWHLPPVFEAAGDRSPVLAVAEQATMVVAGLVLLGAWTGLARRAPRAAAGVTAVTAANGAAVTVMLTIGVSPVAGMLVGTVIGSTYAVLAVVTLRCPHATALLPEPARWRFHRLAVWRGLSARSTGVPGRA